MLGIVYLALLPPSVLPDFPAAWKQERATISQEKREGQAILQLDGARSKVSVDIPNPISDRNLELTFWLKGTEDMQWISIDTKAYKTVNGKRIPAQCRINVGEGYMTTEYARLSKDWKKYTKTINVSRSAEILNIEVENITRQPLYVSTPTLTPGEEMLADLDGPGILRASINVWVKPGSEKKGTISFPVPLVSPTQVPLAFKFITEPANVIKSYRFRRRSDGRNWLCEAEVEPGPAKTKITWESLVLVRDQKYPALRSTKTPEVPKGGEQWLRRTACVQTESPILRAKAGELAKGDPDIETYVRRVIQFTCDNRGTGSPFNRLDAEYAMACGGSCTSRANLAAALLRIRGIPARTVAHLPTWAYGEVLFTHWLVEYWHPGAGWIPVESTWAEFQPPTYTYAALAISSPMDEDGAEDLEQQRWCMPGAPEWTMARFGSKLAPDTEENQQSNWAKPEQRITGSHAEIDRLFNLAAAAYSRNLAGGKYGNADQFLKVERALSSGTAQGLAGWMGR